MAGTDKGEFYIIKRWEQKSEVIQYVDKAFVELGPGVSIIHPFSKGFFVGSEFGNFALWLKAEEYLESDKLQPNTFGLINIWNASSL